jgi:hyperosmotically inducible periplasmic protein
MTTESSQSKSNNNPSGGSRNEKTHRGLFVLLALIVIVGLGAYWVYRENVDVGGALHLAKTASEEAATTARVKAAFALSSKISTFDIDVDTQGGVARLRGEVPSPEVHRLAVALAKDTAGVSDVKDELTVDPSARPSPELEELKSRVADLEIQTELESALRQHPDLRDDDISVRVKDRQVTLAGTVAGPGDKFGAESIASAIDGVSAVENSLAVENPTPSESPGEAAELAKKVEFELYSTDAFDLDRVKIQATADGVVTMTGEVRSQAERLLAQRIASGVSGVGMVNNKLEVPAVPHEAMSEIR